MLRVALLSRWHVHADQYAREIRVHPDAELGAVWDEDAERGRAWAAELGLPFESDLARLLARSDIDAVCVTAPTNRHREVMVAAAEAGKHIFTEKVLAATVADAGAIADAVREHDVRFCISFPRCAMPEMLYAKEAVDSGLLGQPTALRIRNAHDGAVRGWLPEHFYDPVSCGGGAMMDLGAHGMYLCRWLLGQPRRVVSTFTSVTGRTVEDNAAVLIEFENGAVAVNETAFVSFGAFSLEVDGTEGGLRLLSPKDGVQVRSAKLGTREWQRPEALPVARPKPVDQWIAGCVRGEHIDFGLAAAAGLTELMAAAYLAEREGRSVPLPQGSEPG